MYSGLSKNLAFPLAIRVSSQPPNCFKPFLASKPQSLAGGSPMELASQQFAVNFGISSDGCGRKNPGNLTSLKYVNFPNFDISRVSLGRCGNGEKPKNGFCLISARQNYPPTRARTFSSSFAQEIVEDSDDAVDAAKTLPWLAPNKYSEANGVDKAKNIVKKSRSSWEESAEKFLKSGSSTVDSRGRRFVETRSNNYREGEELEEEEGEVDDVSDPRWDKVNNRLNKIVDVNRRSSSSELRKWNKHESWGRKTWKEATESTLPKMVGEGVYGVGPVLAALSAGRREFYALYMQEGHNLSSNNRRKKDKKGFERVSRIAEKIGLSKKEVPKHDLNMLVDNRPHQGLVLDASPLEMVGIKELDPVSCTEQKGELWVALDEVTDPQNLGAIIRSSYFFGASGVVLCAKNSAPLSGVVSKASAGSLEFMELRSCKNMMQFLISSAENGWRVLGGSVSPRATSLNEIEPGAPTILVLGSEGTGLRPLVERSCTQLVRIPGNIPAAIGTSLEDRGTSEVDHGFSSQEFRSFLAVESLNVSVAAGVLLHHLIGSSFNNNSYLEDGRSDT